MLDLVDLLMDFLNTSMEGGTSKERLNETALDGKISYQALWIIRVVGTYLN